jgi:hypothetical protein
MAAETRCQTSGAIYGINIQGQRLSCEVELPFSLDDSDGQPTQLIVERTQGSHIAQSDADWLWQLIRDPA